MSYRLSFEVDTEQDPSELLDRLQEAIDTFFYGVDEQTATVEEIE